ncbi:MULTISPECIES: hypothetical protein [unclassified Modicisalibacter]|uniref:hypothetical protein n=1 Tax=unclassified Modicisalibacter TaxID=2679913 RepID=UPI001CCEA2FE|nr:MULTISPECIES: hypothetical protein [unclassified Modicisalibacter]MBZ9556916.1 hypothetical protein [Modicisalibacter sp. R2A 31.J]MBZ9574371.1 hypothetical protein [Modicisalibacter sp. MOD 31.J]
MKLPIKRGSLMIGLLTLAPLGAQAVDQPRTTVNATVLNEGYVPEVSVSGRTLMGMMVEPGGEPNDGNNQQLYLWLPEEYGTSEHACINLNSRDGQYSALLSLPLKSIPSSPGRPVQVNFVSQKAEYYKHYKQNRSPHQLAVLAELKPDCRPTSQREAVLMAAWDSSPDLKTLIVLANSSRLETLLAMPVTDAGNTRYLAVKCQPIEAPHRIAYDTVCRLDLDKLNQEGMPHLRKMQLVRRSGASLAGKVPVELAR